MKIFQSGQRLNILNRYYRIKPGALPNVLYSFGGIKSDQLRTVIAFKDLINSSMLDSGTFSLHKNEKKVKEKITLEKYCDFCLEKGKHFDQIINYDADFSVDGHEINNRYQEYLESKGLSPIPVLHNLDEYEVDYFCDSPYHTIAIGSMHSRNMTKLSPVVNKLYSCGKRIHLLGVTNFSVISSLPIYSCDSASWSHVARRDCIYYWNPKKSNRNKIDKICMHDKIINGYRVGIPFMEYKYRKQLEKYLSNNYNVSYLELIKGDSSGDGIFYRQLVNTGFFVELEDAITKMHEKNEWIIN